MAAIVQLSHSVLKSKQSDVQLELCEITPETEKKHELGEKMYPSKCRYGKHSIATEH